MIIRLNSIELFAHHGVYEEEIAFGNHFEIDLQCELRDAEGAVTDQLLDTLDYSKLFSAIRNVSENKRFNLLEAFAHSICKTLLGENPIIEKITVKIRKLNPPLDGSVKSVEVELEMRQNA